MRSTTVTLMVAAALVCAGGCGGTDAGDRDFAAEFSDPPVDVTAAQGSDGGTAATGDDHVEQWDPALMPDPCRTLETGEVTAVVGLDASDGTRVDSWPPLCQYLVGPEATLVYVSDNPTPSGVVEFDQLRNSGMPTEPVTGLGDDAYWLASATALHVLVNQTHIKVIFAGSGTPPGEAARAAATELATLVIGRLDTP